MLLGGEMGRHRVRIVVGEGRSARIGFLRFVLESEGYEVVAQASSASELARVLAVHQPDVVVLDDGIGATAVQMTHEVSPNAKVILVWPGAVVPIGGYARVDPRDVLRSLSPTVARAVGTMPVPRENVITPGWADRLKKDPAALREKLEEHDGPSTKRPNVTDLRRRGQHLHPVGDTEPAAAAPLVGDVRIADEDLAPVLPLSALSMPPAAWTSTLPESALVPITAGTAGPPTAAGEWNRRLGTIALGGAVAASAVVIALALSGAGGDQGILSAAGFVQESPAVVIPAPGASLAGATGQPNLFIGTTGLIPIPPSGPVAPGNGGPHGSGSGTGGGGGGTGSGGSGSGGGGGGGGSGGGGAGGASSLPGRSALQNPFGGPPGQTGSHVKASSHKGNHGKSGAAHNHGSHRGKSGQHASQNGLDHRNKH
jgi:hypothetical protein